MRGVGSLSVIAETSAFFHLSPDRHRLRRHRHVCSEFSLPNSSQAIFSFKMSLTTEDIVAFWENWGENTHLLHPVGEFIRALQEVLQQQILDDTGSDEACLKKITEVMVR
jgi:hypothetical protein